MRLELRNSSVEWNLDTLILVDGSEPYTPEAFPADDGLIRFDFDDFTALYSEVQTRFRFDEIVGKTLEQISTLRNTIFENRVSAFAGDGYTIRGSDLLDVIFASAGDDILYDKGADIFRGGAGNDTYHVSNALTDVSEGLLFERPLSDGDGPFVDFDRDAGGIDQVFASVSYVLTPYVENLTLLDQAVAGTGNELANVITGNAAANTLRGEDGDDRLAGGAGNDIIDGGAGTDTLVLGGARGDYAFSRQGASLVATDLRAASPDGADQATTIEAIAFLGGDLRPAGALTGSSANDVLRGTAGSDIFFLDTALGLPSGADTIRNFGVSDRIVTTSAFADPNGDGRISANSSDRFTLPSLSGTTESSGTLKVFSATGVFSHLRLEGTQVEDGVTFYVYATLNDPGTAPALIF